VKTLCAKAMEILMEESNVQRVDAPVTVRMKRRPGGTTADGRRRRRHSLVRLAWRGGQRSEQCELLPLHWCAPIG